MPIITEIRRKLPLSRPADDASDAQSTIHNIPVDDIVPNRSQPRSSFNQNAIVRLADSIRRYGILQPLTVRKVTLPSERAGGRTVFELVAGERRLRAAKLAELVTVPCIIINSDDATSAELAIIENLLREDLNMFEQAEAFQRLISEFHLTQDEAARRVSMSQSAVANKLRILRLLPEERAKILAAGLTERHARALLKLSDPSLRGEVLQHILDHRLNVSATEAYIDRVLDEIARFRIKNPPKAPLFEAESSVSEAFVVQGDPKEAACEQLPPALQAAMAQRRGPSKGCIKGLEPFYQSIRNAVGILERIGVTGRIQQSESEDCVVVTVTLTKADR